MNWIGKFLVIFSFLYIPCMYSQDTSNAEHIKNEKRNYHVRVLLQEADRSQKICWKISSSNGFMLINPDEKTKKLLPDEELTITWKQHCFLINNIAYDNKRFYLSPVQGHLKFEGKEYQGSFLIVQKADHIYLVNSIDIEEYVFSVLRTESWPGWPLEVNKVFAIASRSYVIGVILDNRSSALPYHVKNTNKHQTYSGVHADPILKEAVNQTRGLFLAYNKKPIVAMFDACCGGVVPGDIHGMKTPYLARNYACGFCKDAKNYNWTARYSIDQFEQILKKEFKNIKKIRAINVAKTDKAGLVQQIQIKGHHKSYTISGKKMYSMLSKVRSFCYEIAVNADQVIFKGKGIGHHMGLCQWGAREMVRQGYDYKAILNFYYPNTHFMRLYA